MSLPRAHRRARGSALILALLILFAMLGLGMLAMRSATQNIAGSTNLRLNKQARYVAEVGLYHAVTLMQQKGESVLVRRSAQQTVTIDSAGAVNLVEGDAVSEVSDLPGAPPILEGSPPALGPFAGGLVPSYRVVVDGFLPAGSPPGYSGDPEQVFCRMEFVSRGFVAGAALPTKAQFETADAEARFAESSLKASVVLGPFARTANCNRAF